MVHHRFPFIRDHRCSYRLLRLFSTGEFHNKSVNDKSLDKLFIFGLFETNHELFTGKATLKRATKNVQLVLQHCCKTS